MVCAALPRPRVKWHATHPYRPGVNRTGHPPIGVDGPRCGVALRSPPSTKGFRCLPLPRRRGGRRSSSSWNRSVAGRQTVSFPGHDDSGRGGACHRTLSRSCVWECPRLGEENPKLRHGMHCFMGIRGRIGGTVSVWAKRRSAAMTRITRLGTSALVLSTSRFDGTTQETLQFGEHPLATCPRNRSQSRGLMSK